VTRTPHLITVCTKLYAVLPRTLCHLPGTAPGQNKIELKCNATALATPVSSAYIGKEREEGGVMKSAAKAAEAAEEAVVDAASLPKRIAQRNSKPKP
jgi:hypothetical protein